MKSRRITSRAAVCSLALALAALFLDPCWRAGDAWVASALRSSRAGAALPVVLAEVDPTPDHRLAGDEAVPGPTDSVVVRPDVVFVGRVPADAKASNRPRVDIRSCALRAPPPA